MVAGQEDQAGLEEGAGSVTTVTDADANVGVMPVREGLGFDVDALAHWMQESVAGFDGPLEVLQFKGGQFNPTYKLRAQSGDYVLRRKPAGQLAKGAHAVDREARVLTALGDAVFPVAKVHGLCADQSVIGSIFYVMEMIEGRIF